MTTKGRRWEGDAKRKSEGAAAALGVGGRVKQEPSRLTLIYFRTPASRAACAGSAANWGSEGPARALLGGQGSWRLVGREACAPWPGPPMPSHAHGRPWHACKGNGMASHARPWSPLLQASPLICMYQTRALPFPILGMCQSAWTAHSNCGLLLQVHHTCALAQIALVCASQAVAVVRYPASLPLVPHHYLDPRPLFCPCHVVPTSAPTQLHYTTHSQMHTNTTNQPCGRGLIFI
ncbi:hypothetical protein COCVIDRAFT_35001 [Bipolaris victoriae FI3]|uniref:Uncharacterized protein n=1 Tax=Bipolaris victoriae (strain FI3) TaxID=930091 RepID=W7EI66_BIPV3|nr:hypothetical protein COCVIDRAFT_35001 [Bipolaris victoriae FI3]